MFVIVSFIPATPLLNSTRHLQAETVPEYDAGFYLAAQAMLRVILLLQFYMLTRAQ